MAKIGLVPGKPFDITFLKTLVAFDLKVGAFTQELCDEAQKRGWPS